MRFDFLRIEEAFMSTCLEGLITFVHGFNIASRQVNYYTVSVC